MSHTFVTYIGAEPSKVWEALIQPEGTRRIYFDCILESELKPGSPFAYIGPGNDGPETLHVYGEIVEVEEGRRLVMLEHPGPSYYENHAELTSRIIYSLEQAGSCTKLTLVNDQYSDNHPSEGKAVESWAIVLSSLKTYVETGKSLDFGW